jgi:DNA topoisomerase-1
MNLLIVESPAKAKTIEKYLGKDFTVRSCYGHIRDLGKDKNAVDVENDFNPTYIVPKEKSKVVKELKDWVKKSDEVWLATDEDREGEAISWHLCEVLGLDENTTKRIVFHEITKPALQKAIQTPRLLDKDVVNAQQARRILDRLVGFELSQLLWKKVKGKLSAGRVQSVAVKLIVEREREIQGFKPEAFYKVIAIFKVKNEKGKWVDFKGELPANFKTEKNAADYLNKCVGAVFNIQDVKVRPAKRKPAAPFTTSTLQQEASRKLGFSVSRTMSTAQRLYEAGHITYMRTDSISLSETALQNIAAEITSSFGQNYVQTRRFKTKSDSAQEAHEAIRPTYISKTGAGVDKDQMRLYELIWKRTIASQMADAELERTTVDIGISTIPDSKLVAKGEVLKFDGFLRVYLESTDDEEDEDIKGMLPPLNVGQVVDLNEMTATERFTRSAARYTEASLVKKLEELGIGRPSTYAPTISRIMEPTRGYVTKENRDGEERKYNVLTLKKNEISKRIDKENTGAEKNKLFPSDTGMIVVDFLSEHFDDIMNYGFTADMEKRLDKVADGKELWVELLREFYVPFHKVVAETEKDADRASGERILGKDPKSGRTVLVRLSRYGSVAQIGAPEELDDEEKPRYANLKFNQSIESVTLEEAMELFQLPLSLGDYKGHEVIIGEGRYGPYVKYNEKFISLPKGENPLEFSKESAIELVDEREKADAPVYQHKGLPVTKGSGRFGPFLKWNGMFINIPRKYDPETITQPEMKELIEAKELKEANRYIHNWLDEWKMSVENGRWGPFIRFGKKNFQLRDADGNRLTAEQAKEMTLEQIKAIVEAEVPGAFKAKKKPAVKKKPATKKKPAGKKKPAAKKK